MNKKYIILFLVIVLLIGAFFLYPDKSAKKGKNQVTQDIKTDSIPADQSIETDYRAGFAIFTNGSFRIFTAVMYHNLSEDVFIESSNPNIVHVRKSGVTWDDFFATLPFSLDKDCLITGNGQTFCDGAGKELRFFLNEVEDPDALDQMIKEGDRLLVSFGNQTIKEIEGQIDAIPSLK